DRVLRVTPKPPAQLTIPKADEAEVGSCHQDGVLQTPVTLVSAEGLATLCNLIKQDAHTLNGTSIPRLERRVQKLANAAEAAFTERALLDAERALLHDQNQMLMRMNNEAKVRRSTKSYVLGQGEGKVMSFAEIEEARARRAAKDAIKGKGKRGRKRKSAALEADEPEAAEAEVEAEAEPEVARAVKGKKRGRKRKIAAQEAEESEPEVARMIDVRVAPVARMI
ncbi:hypothetical protein V8E51_007524, partial [Hyaloscypha variabilis]